MKKTLSLFAALVIASSSMAATVSVDVDRAHRTDSTSETTAYGVSAGFQNSNYFVDGKIVSTRGDARSVKIEGRAKRSVALISGIDTAVRVGLATVHAAGDDNLFASVEPSVAVGVTPALKLVTSAKYERDLTGGTGYTTTGYVGASYAITKADVVSLTGYRQVGDAYAKGAVLAYSRSF